MKNSILKKALLLLLALTMLVSSFVACNKNGTQEGEADDAVVDGTLAAADPGTTPAEISRLLTSFTIVRGDNSRTKIAEVAKELNRAAKEITGQNLAIKLDSADEADLAGNLILIGDTAFEASAATKTLTAGEFIIKTVADGNRILLVVGGKGDDVTVKAVNELIRYLQTTVTQDGANTEVPEIDMKSKASDLSMTKEEMQKLVILYPANMDKQTSVVLKGLRNALKTATGKLPQSEEIAANANIDAYPNAIVIGALGSEAKAIQSKLDSRSYAVHVNYDSEKGTRIYLVGSKPLEVTYDIYTVRAVQYFYSQTCVEGVFGIPKDLDVTVKTLQNRDPCIVPYEGKYYLYHSNGAGYSVRVSEDLLNWSASQTVFSQATPGFDGVSHYWAPECHIYNGQFYLLATYMSSINNHRGVAIFRSKTPTGTFELISKRSKDATQKGHLSPADWDAIDITLYVDKQGKPWVVYVHEWTSMADGIGSFVYAPMSDDLSYPLAEPVEMFKATAASWSNYKVTDGCYMYTCKDGSLLMIWSNMGSFGYTVGIARSSNGTLDGKWEQLDPLYMGDSTTVYEPTEGGHGMIFQAHDGRLYLAIHTPNSTSDTAMQLIPIVERDNMLYLDIAQ